MLDVVVSDHVVSDHKDESLPGRLMTTGSDTVGSAKVRSKRVRNSTTMSASMESLPVARYFPGLGTGRCSRSLGSWSWRRASPMASSPKRETADL